MRLRPLLCLALALSASPAAGQDAAALRRELEGAIRDYPGVVGVSVRDLRSGESLSIRGDEPFPTASLIKVPVLVGLLDEVRRGRMRLDERLSLTSADRVGGSGVLKHLAAGLNPTLEDAAWLMIVLSDNTATNLVLDEVGVVNVWAKMDSLGLPRTRVHRKVFQPHTASPLPDSAARYGLGVTTPNETARLLELLHRGQAVSPALDSLALAMLRANQDPLKLVRWLPEDVGVAHKSGYDDRGWNDCGILYTPAAPLALCVMTRENRWESYAADAPANLLIGRVGRIVFRHFNPDVPLPPLPAF
jgi:beta-lactamase class A